MGTSRPKNSGYAWVILLSVFSNSNSSHISMGTSRPKDSGYAWVILLASLCCCYVSGVLVYFVGVIHVELLERYHDDVTTTAWAGALYSGLSMLGAPLATYLVHHYSCRVSTVLGGAVLCVGFAASAFTTTVYQLVFTYGIVAGTGLGLTYTPTLMVVTFNFDRYRALASGVSVSGFALGILSGSLLTQAVINVYGINGAFLIIAGFAFNSSVFGMLYRPTAHEGLTAKAKTKKGVITAKADSVTEKGFEVVNNKPLDMTIVIPSDNEVSKVEKGVVCGCSEPNKTHHDTCKLLIDSEAMVLASEESRSVGSEQTADCDPHVALGLLIVASTNGEHTSDASQQENSNIKTQFNTFPTETGRLVDEEDEYLNNEKSEESRRLLSEENSNSKGDSSSREKKPENGHMPNEENVNALADSSADSGKSLTNGRLLNNEKEKARVDSSVGRLTNEEKEKAADQCFVSAKQRLLSSNEEEDKTGNQRSVRKKETFFTQASSALNAFKPLLCNGAFLCHAFGVFCASVNFSGGYLHLPEYVITLGTSHTQAATLFVGAGSFSLLSRLLAGVLLTSPRVDGLLLSMVFMAVHGVASCLFPLYSAPYWGQMAYASVLGLSTGAYYTLINVLMSKLVSFHLMTRAYGFLIFAMGVGYITGPPMAGMIVDAGGTYEQSFLFLGLVMLVSAGCDLVAYIIHKRQEKGKGQDPV